MSQRDLGRFQMLWDCPFCGSQKLLGIDHRHCPGCGSPQDPDARYFPAEGEEIAVEDHPFHGADRVCPACSTPNAAIADYCVNCGSPLSDAARAKKVDETPPAPPVPAPPPKRSRKGCLVPLGLLLVLLLIGICAAVCLWKREAPVTVTGHSWERTIEVEKFATVTDSAWRDEVPRGAKNTRCSKEQRSTEKVADGETCKTVKKDNGDGTFTKVEECSPRYVEKAVMDEKCTFQVEKWTTARTEKATGSSLSSTPTWPDVKLSAKEREGDRKERYVVSFDMGGEAASCTTSQQRWSSLAVGSQYNAKVGVVTDSVDCDSLTPR